MNVILTGGSGFIGSNLVKHLSKLRSFKVMLISRKKISTSNHKNVILLETDLSNIEKHKKKIIKFNPKILIHLAWDKIPNFSFLNCKDNERKTKILINFLCKNTNLSKIIISGSCFEIKPPNKSYNYFKNSKINILNFLKKKCLENDIIYNWMRLFYVYGPGQRKNSIIPFLLNCAKNNQIANIKDPNKRHDFIYIDDVCRAVILTIMNSKNSNIIEIGSGKITSVNKLLVNIKKLTNGKLNYKKNNFSKKNTILKANINKAKNYINWTPKTKIIDGLKKTIGAF